MDNTSTVIGIGVGLVAVIVSFVIYKNMGCAPSVNTTNNSAGTTNAAASGKKAKKEEAADKYPAGKMSIYFGSQTGTAEGFARTLMEEGKNAGFDAKTIDLEEFDADTLEKTHLAIFLMATYGEGEPTDNAAAFFKWLKNEDGELSDSVLSKINYCVFGLGNRQYEHFNRMGKTTDAKLEALGAKRAFEYGEGDDDGTLEEDFDTWKTKLWPALYEKFHPAAKSDSDKSKYRSMSMDDVAKVKLSFTTVAAYGSKKNEVRPPIGSPSAHSSSKVNSSTRHFFTAPHANVLVNRELRTNDPSGSTRHIEIDLKGTGVSYHTADNLAILPENDSVNVEALAAAMGYDLDYVFQLEPVGDESEGFKQPFPTPCTVRDLLTCYLDIQGAARHATLKHVMAYAEDSQQQAWCAKLISKENRHHFKSYIEEGGKSLCDLLTHELSSCKIPLADLIHLTQYIQPRYYTISSSSSVHPDVVHITVSITEYKLKTGKTFVGLCSGFLKSMTPGQKCRIYNRASSFRLPNALSTPIVMIGPGTGIAPMRALLQEREYQNRQSGATSTNLLYFGCKHQAADFIYRDELTQYQQNGTLTQIFTAFSRDSDKKVYVQHLLAEKANAQQLMDMVFSQNAFIFVCGATAMGTDVMNTCVKLLQEHKGMNQASATAFLKDMQEKGRYVQELWTA